MVVLKISENMKKNFSDRSDFEVKLVCNFAITNHLRWCYSLYTAKLSRSIFSQNSSRNLHCVKSVRIGSYSGPLFSTFSLRIRENADQNNSEDGLFSRSVFCAFINLQLASVVKKNLPYKLEDFYLDSFGSDSTTLRNQLSMVCLTGLREIFVCRKTGGYQWIGK